MAKWRYTINLEPVWKNYSELDEDDFTDELFKKMKKEIVEKIKERIQSVDLAETKDLISGMENSEDLEEFNDYFRQLYDWADYSKVWIKTFF